MVTIATPNFTHYEITKACLEAGLHVICEKPLFFTVAECEEIAALADEKGLNRATTCRARCSTASTRPMQVGWPVTTASG